MVDLDVTAESVVRARGLMEPRSAHRARGERGNIGTAVGTVV